MAMRDNFYQEENSSPLVRSSDTLREIGNLDFYVQISDFQKYCIGQIKSRPAACYFKDNFRTPSAADAQHTSTEKLSPINAGEDIMSPIWSANNMNPQECFSKDLTQQTH